jgi:hypothetical protein
MLTRNSQDTRRWFNPEGLRIARRLHLNGMTDLFWMDGLSSATQKMRTPAEPMPPPIKEPEPEENPNAPVREPDPEEPEMI